MPEVHRLWMKPNWREISGNLGGRNATAELCWKKTNRGRWWRFWPEEDLYMLFCGWNRNL